MGNYSYDNTKYIGSIDYKIGQEIESCRLMQGYTQKDLANKIGVSQQQIQRYEQGVNHTLTEKLYDIAKALLVEVEVLLPEIEEGCYEGGNSKTEKELSSLIRGYQKIKNQAARDRFNVLAESLCEGMLVIKEKVSKAEKIQVANNLFILGISIDIICQITGLSTDEIA